MANEKPSGNCRGCQYYWQDLKACSIGPKFLGYIKENCRDWEDKGTIVPEWEQLRDLYGFT
jgi:hypothetical protein